MLFCRQESQIREMEYKRMKRKMLRTVGILSLVFVLSIGMVGCTGQADSEPGTSDIQGVTLNDGVGAGSCSEIEDGSEESRKPSSSEIKNAEINRSDEAGNSDEIKDSGEAESNNEVGNNVSEERNTESVYFEGADLNGRVLEFSDTGFKMTPVHTVVYEDGTRNSWEAAPGKEKEEDNIYVTYKEDTVFEVVYFSMSLQEVSSREDADKSDIKKQTMVYVFGSSEDERNWIADKVLIQRWD